MDSDGDSNSVSRDISPTNERTSYAVNKVQNDQNDVDENTIIIIDDSPDDEPVRAPLVRTNEDIKNKTKQIYFEQQYLIPLL